LICAPIVNRRVAFALRRYSPRLMLIEERRIVDTFRAFVAFSSRLFARTRSTATAPPTPALPVCRYIFTLRAVHAKEEDGCSSPGGAPPADEADDDGHMSGERGSRSPCHGGGWGRVREAGPVCPLPSFYHSVVPDTAVQEGAPSRSEAGWHPFPNQCCTKMSNGRL